jgi:hypothetical protein
MLRKTILRVFRGWSARFSYVSPSIHLSILRCVEPAGGGGGGGKGEAEGGKLMYPIKSTEFEYVFRTSTSTSCAIALSHPPASVCLSLV